MSQSRSHVEYRARCWLACSLVLVAAASLMAVQAPAGAARPSNTAPVEAGAALFRQRCADCHGPDAKGDRGPDLTRLWASEGADERAFQTIRAGVPGSIMPPASAPDDEI